MKKILLAMIILLSLVSGAAAGMPELYVTISPALLAAPGTSYGVLAGVRAGIKAVNGQFLFLVSVGAGLGSAQALSYEEGSDTRAYGMYSREWFAENQAAGTAASYASAEFSAGFGWNVLNLFAKRQFVCIEFGGRYEDEKIGETAFHKFGRYHSEIYLLTELLEFDNFRLNFKAGAGGISCDTGGSSGFVNYGVFMLEGEFDTLLFRITSSRKPAEEGETMWE